MYKADEIFDAIVVVHDLRQGQPHPLGGTTENQTQIPVVPFFADEVGIADHRAPVAEEFKEIGRALIAAIVGLERQASA